MNLLTDTPETVQKRHVPAQPQQASGTEMMRDLKSASRRIAKMGQKALRVARVNANAGLRAMPVTREALNLPSNRTFTPQTSEADGVKIHIVHPEHAFERTLPHMPFEKEVHERFRLGHRGKYDATFVAELHRGRIWGFYGGSVFTRDGQLVPSLSKDVWGPKLHSAYARHRLPRPEWLPGKTLSLITPEAAGNFHHWMIDLLPRIGVVEQAGYSLRDFDRVLIKYRALPFQIETLRRAGIDERRIVVVDDQTHIEAETLIVPSIHMDDSRVSAPDMRYVRSLFVPQEPPRGTAWRRLYVGRADAAYRRVTNGPEFQQLLDRYGFEEVAMSKYTVAEGAKLFSEAAVVMGPNGSAIANLLFAHPECRVIEFFAPEWVVAYNWMIAVNLGLDYTALIGKGTRPPPGTLPRDIRQDVELEIEQLERVLEDAFPNG